MARWRPGATRSGSAHAASEIGAEEIRPVRHGQLGAGRLGVSRGSGCATRHDGSRSTTTTRSHVSAPPCAPGRAGARSSCRNSRRRRPRSCRTATAGAWPVLRVRRGHGGRRRRRSSRRSRSRPGSDTVPPPRHRPGVPKRASGVVAARCARRGLIPVPPAAAPRRARSR